jgi:hypothetical protein
MTVRAVLISVITAMIPLLMGTSSGASAQPFCPNLGEWHVQTWDSGTLHTKGAKGLVQVISPTPFPPDGAIARGVGIYDSANPASVPEVVAGYMEGSGISSTSGIPALSWKRVGDIQLWSLNTTIFLTSDPLALNSNHTFYVKSNTDGTWNGYVDGTLIGTTPVSMSITSGAPVAEDYVDDNCLSGYGHFYSLKYCTNNCSTFADWKGDTCLWDNNPNYHVDPVSNTEHYVRTGSGSCSPAARHRRY